MFEIGDRVQLNCNITYVGLNIGDVGTVCEIIGNDLIGVDWGKYISGHGCGGKCKNGYGWRVRNRQVDLVEDELDFYIEEDAFIEVLNAKYL